MAVTTRRRPVSEQNGTAITFLSAVALLLTKTEGSVFDTPAEDLEEEDYVSYAQEVGVATAGLGIGLSIWFGFIAFVAMLAMCCRCKRLHRADLAIAMAEAESDGKGLDDMYEIEDYEDNISKHRKILWLFSLVLFLGYLFCAGYAYNGAKTTNASFASIFDGTDVLMTRVQLALCAENGGANCAEGSVGTFLLDVADAIVDRLEGVVGFLSGLSVITAPLLVVSSVGVINTTEEAVVNINDAITNVNLVLGGDSNAAELTGGETVEPIPDSVFDDIQDGRDALAEAADLTENSMIEISDQLMGNESTITRMKYQLDDIHGNEILGDADYRNETLTVVVEDVLEPIRDLTEDIYDLQQEDFPQAREGVDGYIDIAVTAVAGIIFLPGAILLVTSLCSGICRSSKPLYLNMFFVFMTQSLFCLVAGIFLAIAKINGDICDHHLSLIEANFQGANATVQEVEIIVDFAKIEKVLVCDGVPGDVPSSSNNFVDIFGAQQIFNISAYISEASTLVTDNSGLISEPKGTIRDAQTELEPLTDFVNTDFVGDVNISDTAAEIDDLLVDLPPTPFDWDDQEHQDSIDNFYLKDETEYSWNNESTGDITYRSQLESVNHLISLMYPGVIGVGEFEDIQDPYNFEQARNLTNDTVCASDSPFQPSTTTGQELNSATTGAQIYTYEGQYEDLCNNVTVYYETTEKLETLVEENGETRLDLENVRYQMELIETNITTITDQQTSMGDLRDSMNDTLGALAVTLDELVEDLNALADDLDSLNDVVMGANNFTMCGYIGDFYQDVYLDATCTDLQGNIEAVAGPALTVVILMFISFCIQGCYGPSMRKRPRGAAGDFDGDKQRLNDSADAQNFNLPTLHSPSPLVGNSGF